MIKTGVVKMRAGDYMIPVILRVDEKRIEFDFPFNRTFMEEVKSMEGRKWHGGKNEQNPRKVWSVKNSPRNWFQIEYLRGGNPYKNYKTALLDLPSTSRPLFNHQKEMIQFALTRKQCMFACEMGTGKTLAAIEVMENSGTDDWYWVGPRSALAAARMDFAKWDAKVDPVFMTYEGLKGDIDKQGDAFWIPSGVIFDESAKIKTPTAQRSQAASILVEEMRKKNSNCFILLMSGAPAPRNPSDWWHQLEVACPGYIKEGSQAKFKDNLSITVEKEGLSGVYPHIVTWLDDERKCKICGALPEDHFDPLVSPHDWQASVNEVARLYKRMDGLVLTKFKKDCLELPDLHFIRHKVEPSKQTLRLLNLVKTTATRTITALIQIRELSDGFQYKDTEDEDGKVTREVVETQCPKDKLLVDLLDEHSDIGRFIVYAGFQGSVDRVCRIALAHKWDVIRVDGRGWHFFNKSQLDTPTTPEEMLELFQSNADRRLIFVGQPGAAGMGLTLTASPSIFFFSNTFAFEDRIQTIARIHRPGMDLNLGAKIIDVIHLPVDEYILDNLDKKENLQDLSLGRLKEHM